MILKRRIYKYLILLLLAFIIFLPILWLMISAFKSPEKIINETFGMPDSFHLLNFEKLNSIPGFWLAFKNSIYAALISSLLIVIITVPFAYIISRFHFPFKSILEKSIILLGYLFAPVILAFPYFKLFTFMGIAETIMGIALLHFTFSFPFAMLLNRIMFDSLPIEYEEVALIDKIPFQKILMRIILPEIRIQLFALFMLVFAISWKEFFFSFILSYTGKNITLPVLLSILYGGESINWELVCALGTVMMLPSIVFLIVLYKTNLNNLFFAPPKG